MNDTTSLVGKILDEAARRDAVHFAVAPVIADEAMRPGQHCGFVEEGNTDKVWSKSDEPIGIVDPFLTEPVLPGQRFFLFLYPQTITSLRHEWTHPAFENAEAVRVMDKVGHGDESREWLKNYAHQNINSYIGDREEAFAKLLEDIREGRVFGRGCDVHNSGDIDPEMWKHLETIGIFASPEDMEFSCSC